MDVIDTSLCGVLKILPRAHRDNRGFFLESWSKNTFLKMGLDYDFIQDNHSLSKHKGTLRGIHFQRGDKAQAKLVRCVSGVIFDVAVDLRPKSKTYGQWVGVELSAENQQMLLVPRGFGHGFLTLSDNAEVIYKVDNVYAPEAESGVIWNDPDLSIEWGVASPILSEKDSKNPLLKNAVTGY